MFDRFNGLHLSILALLVYGYFKGWFSPKQKYSYTKPARVLPRLEVRKTALLGVGIGVGIFYSLGIKRSLAIGYGILCIGYFYHLSAPHLLALLTK